jgi:hypothetical protein
MEMPPCGDVIAPIAGRMGNSQARRAKPGIGAAGEVQTSPLEAS